MFYFQCLRHGTLLFQLIGYQNTELEGARRDSLGPPPSPWLG